MVAAPDTSHPYQHPPLRPAKPATKQSGPQSTRIPESTLIHSIQTHAPAHRADLAINHNLARVQLGYLLQLGHFSTSSLVISHFPRTQSQPNRATPRCSRSWQAARLSLRPFVVGLVRPRIIAAGALAKAGIRRPVTAGVTPTPAAAGARPAEAAATATAEPTHVVGSGAVACIA
jgi:hypothetical protein